MQSIPLPLQVVTRKKEAVNYNLTSLYKEYHVYRFLLNYGIVRHRYFEFSMASIIVWWQLGFACRGVPWLRVYRGNNTPTMYYPAFAVRPLSSDRAALARADNAHMLASLVLDVDNFAFADWCKINDLSWRLAIWQGSM